MTNLANETGGAGYSTQLSDGNPNGTVYGQSTSDLIGFYGTANPVAQQASTVPLVTQLINLGLVASGTSGSSTLSAQAFAQTAAEPSATGGDYVLAVYSVPASTLSAAGKGLRLTASGSYGATANTKTCKLIFNPSAATVGSTVTGGTTVATTGALTQSGTGWVLESSAFKIGSNTQVTQQTRACSGAVEAGCGVPAFPTATDTGAILVAVTGNAATAVSDINLNLFTVSAVL